MGIDAFIVHMPQEMYKDALYFFRDAEANHGAKGEVSVTWRNLRAAILFAFAAIETCINQFIDAHVEQNRAHMPSKTVRRWTEKQASIGEKLNNGIELYGGKPLALTDALGKEFEELRALRNALVHYKMGDQLFYDTDSLLQRTRTGIQTASEVIKKIYLEHPGNTAYPPTFDEKT